MSLADQQWCPTSVQVTVLQARGLRIKGKSGTNDAYAVIQLGKEKYQTSVVEKSVAPVWKEEATFDLPPQQQGAGGAERSTLHVHVLHRALVGPDKLLGQAVINLAQLSEDKDRNKTEWFKLLDKTGKPDKDRGEVLVDIQFMRNNMTASMFDLSAAGKSRSRLGKLKDKVRGKKKESDSASSVVPSFTQVLTDSEEEEATGEGVGEAIKDGKSKKHKIKSIFSQKSNLQRNMSQSMSVLPAKNSSVSTSQSSDLNADLSEGKKKFKFMMHKRSGSSDGKDSSFGHQKQVTAEQSNLCINGSHIYCEEQPLRTSRTSSSYSLTSSGRGSMEEAAENSPPSVDSLRVPRQYSPWMEEEEDEEEKDENIEYNEDEPKEEVRRIRTEEEEKKTTTEETIAKQMEIENLAKETFRQEECKKQEEKAGREEEERIWEEEEKRKREEEERIRRENEKRQEEEERVEQRRKEEHRLAEKKKMEEEKRRIEEEKARWEEEQKKNEEERAEEERRLKQAKEEEMRKVEELKRQREQEKMLKQQEEERARKEKEECERLMEEKRKLEEEKKRIEAEETLRKVEEEKKTLEEEMKRKDEERRAKREEELEEKRRLEEQERKRLEQEKMQREEEERIRKDRLKQEEEARRRQQEELEEERRKLEEEKVKKEEERIKREEEKKLKEQDMLRRQEEEQERLAKEMLRQEEERKKLEMVKREEEKRKEEKRQKEEEKARKEKEAAERLAMETKRLQEQEKMRIEEARKEEEERIRREERAEKESKEKEAAMFENEILIKEVDECEKKESGKSDGGRAAGNKSKVSTLTDITSTNPFDEDFSYNPSVEMPSSSSEPHSHTDEEETVQERCQSSVSVVGSRAVSANEKDSVGTQREKRPAPQPPGKNQAERQKRDQQDESENNQTKDKTVTTVGVLPQRSVQIITPLTKSAKDSENTQSVTQDKSTKVASARHSKRPAPSRPSVEEPLSELKTALFNKGVSETKQSSYGLNPFDDTDENELVAQDDAAATGPVHWHPITSQNADKDTSSQVKVKSLKVARAPPPPAKNDAALSSFISHNNDGGHITSTASRTVPSGARSQPGNAVTVLKSPKELQQMEVKDITVTSVKEEAPPSSRRLQPVKPFTPPEPQPASVVQVENNKSTGILSGDQDKIKVDSGMAGPYSQLTREELISLVLKQENQLSDRVRKISELEQYIDNLLVRVIEEKPSILMSLSSLKKTV